MRRSKPKGAVLLTAMIVMTVLLLLVVGAITFTGKNREAATGKMRGDQVNACAEAARRHLMSRLGFFNIAATVEAVQINESIPHGPGGPMQISTGHYDNNPADVGVVKLTASTAQVGNQGARDLANAMPGASSFGGSYYGVVVTCRDSSGREAEVEFAFRYGL